MYELLTHVVKKVIMIEIVYIKCHELQREIWFMKIAGVPQGKILHQIVPKRVINLPILPRFK